MNITKVTSEDLSKRYWKVENVLKEYEKEAKN